MISSSAKLNFLIRLDQAKKLTVANMRVMHTKFRELEEKKPSELLFHYKFIINSLCKILAMDYDLQMEEMASERRVSTVEIEEDEIRSDIVFQMFLLMIDVFYQTYPQYSALFDEYIEEEFSNSKIFFALTQQVSQIGQAFNSDYKDLDRTWLVQTLSYLHLLLKMLRISFVKHIQIEEQREAEEKLKKAKLEAMKKGGLVMDKRTICTIDENTEESEMSSDYHVSANFGGDDFIEPPRMIKIVQTPKGKEDAIDMLKLSLSSD